MGLIYWFRDCSSQACEACVKRQLANRCDKTILVFPIIFPYVLRAKKQNRQNRIIFAKRFIECGKYLPLNPSVREYVKASPKAEIIVESEARELREKSYFIKKKKGFKHFNGLYIIKPI